MLALAAVGASVAAGSAFADTSDKRIALSNNYAGNSSVRRCSAAGTM